ncbi:Nucleotidyl transferase AbiEii toxin, Type IV TA system [Desulfurobacterium pacificum]|uniref:Nucleotidyl transferase AbiEii toxin, Type IV TA system n=1 Tax=Desulfurobacterium pacificum TaxID=240166 RepID=A0ABY1NLW1_9BACT|nr:nucleotidyl transferase AbiEii/AbiGii toxin family protein [Desulfurobacterium pacificum]SMP12685.1 Nucleotidyl transferase AbiEii toxin, Type IV TA system [Desulfurobacterium pacificum]
MHTNITYLYKLQDEVLSALSEFAKENEFPFVLTGGTALVRFLLKQHYRISYDLDFFSDRLNVFKYWNKKELEFFLLQNFNVVTFLDLSSSSLRMWRGVVGYNNTLVNIDFVDDQFSGIFKTTHLEGFPHLKVETIDEGIYFRKLFAVITGADNEKTIERIKDVVDLIQLDKVIPLPEFIECKFIPIMKENVGILDTEQFLTKFRLLHRILNENREEATVMLKETLLTKLTIKGILRWVEEKLKDLTVHFQQNR